MLVDVRALRDAYYRERPDPDHPLQRVIFGTSGHRGSSLRGTFTEGHVMAIVQAVCDHRRRAGIDGPLFVGMDTHALSEPAQRTALEVLAANDVEIVYAPGRYTPTPVISHAILTHNRDRTARRADGLVITSSHNPPDDGGIKYNPPHGGPADVTVARWIQDRANELLKAGNADVRRVTYETARRRANTHAHDFVMPYVRELGTVVDLEVVRSARIPIGVDPMGGSSVAFWDPIATHYGLELTVTNPSIDETFAFMPVDHDGKIRMDCSSPYAMANLVRLKDSFAIAFGTDPDADRHGIVTRSVGLMNPNHYLSVVVDDLFQHRPAWRREAAVGKTLVTSGMIDRIAAHRGRRVVEVPVGFRWFVEGLLDGTLGFAGEESAGASLLRRDGTVWTADKDGIAMGLLAAEILARSGRDPGEYYHELEQRFGIAYYTRIDVPATPEEKTILERLSPEAVRVTTLGGEPIAACLTHAPGNGAPIGGIKIVAPNGWFAARPSGTEDMYKIYAESFVSPEHLDQLVNEAREIVGKALRGQ